MPRPSFFARSRHPYYIAAPDFRQSSGGIRALYSLCHILNELGYEAYVANESSSLNHQFRSPLLKPAVRAAHERAGLCPIGVFPEVAHGNILKTPIVARWILNKPGHLGGDNNFHPEEILFYWDDWMMDGTHTAQMLQLPIIDRRIFCPPPPGTQRKGFCFYANKYFKFSKQLSKTLTENGIDLGLHIPRSHQEIAHILQTSEVFYCYEPSALVLEARACGCPAVFVETPYLQEFNINLGIYRVKEEDIGHTPIPPHNPVGITRHLDGVEERAWTQIEAFIERTQAAAEEYLAQAHLPEKRLQSAITAFNADNLETASTTFSELLGELPGDPLPPAYLSFIAARQGMADEAAEFISHALEIAPQRSDLLAALGESLLKAGLAADAQHTLQEAIGRQPDLLAAYPALAQSLHLTGKTAEAVSLLQMVANLPGPAQDAIRSTLLELLIRQGDIEGFALACRRFSRGLTDDLLAARHLGRIDASGEACVEALLAAQERLTSSLPQTQSAATAAGATASCQPGQLMRIAFMCSDFARESLQHRLAALLQHLPPERFLTLLIIDDAQAGQEEYIQFCSLLADYSEVISGRDDAKALAQINALAPDILIDLDGYGAGSRLPVLAAAAAPHKLLWGESPLPPLDPAWRCISAANNQPADAPTSDLLLPALGECLIPPELPLSPTAADTSPGQGTRFACLTPAIRIPRRTWQLFAQVLHAVPGSRLTLNLHDLEATAEHFIRQVFAEAGITPEQLIFIHARSLEDLCHHWQQADIGLAPPVDAGEYALPTCLWMGRPYLALASPLPWSQRPAALLAAVGAEDWLATTEEEFVALARRLPPAANPAFRSALRQLGLTDPAAFADGFAAAITALRAGGQA